MPKSKSRSIDAYRAKRDFKRTPEPLPGEAPTRIGAPSFVVHRHEARRLHYDLRLEMNGVLKSWAVPRGFSYDPTVKRLAVHTEDHPLEYEHFEGVIPKDAYGAGTMTIWDRGCYRILKADDGATKVAEGKLELVLFGQKLRGEWHLVRTNAEKDEWLLFKARDRYARSDNEPAPFFDLSTARQFPLPDEVEAMEIGQRIAPFSNPEWIFEMKFLGQRLFATKQGDLVGLKAPSGQELTLVFDNIVCELAEIRAENALLDGVVVALDDAQRPSVEKLKDRIEGVCGEKAYFYVFDILYYEEWDLRELPLAERKTILASVLPRLHRVLFVDHLQGRGEDLLERTSAAGLPAVVAKEASSTYVSGRSSNWREIVSGPAENPQASNVLEALSQAGPQRARRKVKFTNPGKVFWPAEGITKGDLIAYYEQVADILLPYLHERPVHMLRYPDGIEGKLFYQKDAPEHIPEWIETEAIASETRGEPIRYIVCNDTATLLYLINLGTIDLHPWLSRRANREAPDWAVLDLDPKEAPFSNVVKIARSLGKLLRGIGLTPYLKTSGKSGLHIYIPLLPQYTYENARMFCEMVARFVAKDHKDIATVERVVSQRGKRVYIDYLQNHQGQTLVPPYVVRPVPGAWVSAPLDWDELDSELHPSQFTVKTMSARIAKVGDLFRGTLRDRQDLLPAIEALQNNYL